MSRRHRGESVSASFRAPVEVPSIDGGVPKTDSVMTLYAADVRFGAPDEEEWQFDTQTIGPVRGALSMKTGAVGLVWMGYSGGAWRALEGLSAEPGLWHVKIDIDTSLGDGRERIRYSVCRPGEAYVALTFGDETWLPLGQTSDGESDRLEHVSVYGAGEAGRIELWSGCRPPSGTIEVSEDLGPRLDQLILEVRVADAWSVSSVGVDLAGEDGSVRSVSSALSDTGIAKFDLSGLVTPGMTYCYEVRLLGSFRGEIISSVVDGRSIFLGSETDWFGFKDGVFLRSTSERLIIDREGLVSDPISSSGALLPTVPPPQNMQGLSVESTVVVAGAVQEADLSALGGAGVQGALTIVRFESDDVRAWACRCPDGNWTRLYGVHADNGTYQLQIKLDYRSGQRGVFYFVQDDAGEWVLLKDSKGRCSFELPPGQPFLSELAICGGMVERVAVICRSAKARNGGLTVFVR